MTRPLSVVTKLPDESSTRTTGCGAKTTPAVAVDGGWVWIVSFEAAPALTWVAGLLDCWIDGLVRSDAVSDWVPTVLSVTPKTLVPEARAALAGSVTFGSLEVIPIVWETLVTTLQFASTALTVTLKAVPAFWASTEPVLPFAAPGAQASPGTSSCSFARAPAFPARRGLVSADFEPSRTSA